MYKNNKYKAWANTQISRKDIETYIGLNIYPEDIEIFMNITKPSLTLYKDSVLRIPTFCSEIELQEIQNSFDNLLSQFSRKDAERIFNYTSIIDIFLNTCHETDSETFENIAKFLQENWKIHLKSKFNNKKFCVEIFIEDEPFITFYEEDQST